MKTGLSIVLMLLLNLSLNAQNFWAYGAGSIKEDEAMDICTDPSGNIISAGYFSGQTNFNFFSNLILNPNVLGSPDIYVSKSTASGQVLWAKKAGGTGSDRALSVKTDGQGNIYITGYYYGSATFGSVTLTSVSGSQDGFIAKLDANGNFLWAKSFGGSLAEWGNAIAIDDLGNPIITGQFQGTANFGGTTLMSMTNPNTGFASFDVFVAKYDPAGTLTWVNQGKGKYDDRGLDIITDPANNIYVCGQFSDTVQFQNTHNNTIMNASFIIKYNAPGQEQWFRKASGVFSIPYSMVMDNASNIYVTGDFQGTFTYFGSSGNNFINGTYTNKAFLLKINTSGSFIWGRSESSNNYVSGKRVALDIQQNPYIFGEFGCTMNEYSDAYGPGIFNSIGFQDLFITKYNNSGTRQWYRQYGGPRSDRAHGLLLAGINEPVMAGSYEHHLNIPSTSGSIINTNSSSTSTNLYPANQPTGYCSSPNNYTDYRDLYCNGYSDIFIFKGIDLSRKPYDYYARSGTACNLNFVGSCIRNASASYSFALCPDTINFCVYGQLFADDQANHSYQHYNYAYNIGPIHTYTWNNSASDTLSVLPVFSSGYNSVKVSTLDGCYTSFDTVYVKINPLPPPPVITDSYGANTLQPPATTSISICGPSTITLTGGNVQNTSYAWSGPYLSTHDSIAVLDASGTYSFTVTDPNGCVNGNHIYIFIDAPYTLPAFAPKQKNDSLEICLGASGDVIVFDTLTNPGGIYPYGCVNHGIFSATSSPGLSMAHLQPCDLSFRASAPITGWYHYTILYGIAINTLCNNQTYSVTLTDSIYIKVKPLPSGTITATGNAYLCPGDSTYLSVTSVSVSANTSYTTSPVSGYWTSYPGFHTFTIYMEDTISHCVNNAQTSLAVSFKPNPFIILNPFNAIICPNDSVLLSVNLAGAINYEWHGPGGIIPYNTQSLYRQTPGFYHCIVTDQTGCIFTTNPVEIKQYATPYLISTPTNIICNNHPLNLHVVTLDSTLISWSSPLSGGGATKVINSPGTYSCHVNMCNIITPLSITILGSNPVATISSIGSNTVCPFDSVTLYGNAGMTNYVWQPGNHTGQNYIVHAPGSYTLEVADMYGCIARSVPVVVSFTSSVAPPLSTIHDTICAGQTATLSAIPSGTNQLQWFPYSNSGPVLATGTTFTTPALTNQTTYYVASVAPGGCHSTSVPATVFIHASSLPAILSADTTVCKTDTINITTPFISGANYNWSGPGTISGNTNVLSIPNANPSHSGIYSLQLSGFGCTGSVTTISITVIDVTAPVVSGLDSVCENSYYNAFIQQPNSAYSYQWSGPSGYTSFNDSLIFFNTQANQSGTYSVTATQLGCTSQPSLFHLTVLQTPPIPVITSNTPICAGDSIHFTLSNSSGYDPNWLGPNNFSSQLHSPSILATDTSFSGVYFVLLTNVFCSGQSAYDTITVLDYPVLTLGNDTTVCDNNPLTISSTSNYGNYIWNNGGTGPSITITQGGSYWVTSYNGMCSVTDTVHITMVNCNISSINVFTPNGDGINDVFSFRSAAIRDIQCDILDRWGIQVGTFEGRNNGWNGVHMTTNVDCGNDTYFYVAKIITIEGISQTVKGFVTLMR